MDKARLIRAIFETAKNAAIVENKPFDAGDLFLSLAFMAESELESLCKQLRIAA